MGRILIDRERIKPLPIFYFGQLIFTYISDTNYNASTNEPGGQFTFSPSGYFSGTAAKADKLTTACTLTIGSKGKTFDGSAPDSPYIGMIWLKPI